MRIKRSAKEQLRIEEQFFRHQEQKHCHKIKSEMRSRALTYARQNDCRKMKRVASTNSLLDSERLRRSRTSGDFLELERLTVSDETDRSSGGCLGEDEPMSFAQKKEEIFRCGLVKPSRIFGNYPKRPFEPVLLPLLSHPPTVGIANKEHRSNVRNQKIRNSDIGLVRSNVPPSQDEDSSLSDLSLREHDVNQWWEKPRQSLQETCKPTFEHCQASSIPTFVFVVEKYTQLNEVQIKRKKKAWNSGPCLERGRRSDEDSEKEHLRKTMASLTKTIEDIEKSLVVNNAFRD